MSTIGSLTRQAAAMAANAARSLVPQPEARAVDTVSLADPTQEKDWTVLVYLEGRDRLAHSTMLALNKMESVGSSDRVNVVAQATVVPTWKERTFPQMGRMNTRRYYVQADSDPDRVTSPVVGDLGERVRLGQETLADFLAWGMQKFPAKRYLVVVKKHGLGYAKMGDTVPLSARDLQGALANARARTGRSVDVLAFDSCSMGQMEVAHQVRHEARVMTASPEDVFAVDFPYAEVLQALPAAATAEEAGKAVVAAHAKAVPYGIHSALDLGRTGAFATAMGRLVDALVEEQVPRERIYTAMMASASLEPRESLRFGFNFRDLGSFLANLEAGSPRVEHALDEARQAFEGTKLAHAIHPRKAHAKNSTGPSAFLPWKAPREAVREGFEELDYARDAHWSRLMDYLYEGEPPAARSGSFGPDTQGLGLGQKAAKLALMGYKEYVSPFLGVACPYTPSCSQYTREAIETHGLWEGGKLGLMRFLSCNGHGAGGDDPVPGSPHHHDHDHDHGPAALATVRPPSGPPKGELRRRLETGLFRAAHLAGRLAGGMAGLVAGAPAGLALGAFFAWKAGTATIDAHNAKLMKKYREQAVRSLIRLEKPVAMPAFHVHRKVQEWTGSPRLAAAVGGPVGTALGALLGAAGGAAMGWRWGALFGGLLAQNATKDLLGELPPNPANEAILQQDYR